MGKIIELTQPNGNLFLIDVSDIHKVEVVQPGSQASTAKTLLITTDGSQAVREDYKTVKAMLK